MKCPPLNRALIISDDPQLSAQISCLLGVKGFYLPIVEKPRSFVPDQKEELIRKTNAIGRSRATRVVFAGMSEEDRNLLVSEMSPALQRLVSLETVTNSTQLVEFSMKNLPTLKWGRDRIGVGLLRALREGRILEFCDAPSPHVAVPSRNGHIVICEDGEPMSEVIAANYAYALSAGLLIIPGTSREKSEEVLEQFYSAYESGVDFSERMEILRHRLTESIGHFAIPDGGSITFVTGGLPYGFSIRDFPSTHLFKYPDLGTAVINGFAAEQVDAPHMSSVSLVDPSVIPAAEIEIATKLLSNRGAFVRNYAGPSANVRSIAKMVEWFPYDLLVIATHCGDADGWQWTYEFEDSEGMKRIFVVDIAIGVGQADRDEKLHVTQFMRFVSLDGVDWRDPQKSEKVYVGQAVHDLLKFIKNDKLKPVKKEKISRVVGSTALKMYDDNIILLPKPLADYGTPIVINNACSSWHRLASNMMYGNARAYVGTLHPITSGEAEAVVKKLLERHFDKPLPGALWSAQREVYRSSPERRPYIVAGVYPQRLKFSMRDFFPRILRRLSMALKSWEEFRTQAPQGDEDSLRLVEEAISYYEKEISFYGSQSGFHRTPRDLH